LRLRAELAGVAGAGGRCWPAGGGLEIVVAPKSLLPDPPFGDPDDAVADPVDWVDEAVEGAAEDW
jgi:hypothetical protein